MSLLAPWLLFPAVLGALSLGSGLLVEQASAVRLPDGLLLPTGLAVMVVAGQFTTMGSATASLTVPLVVGLAAAGFLLAGPGILRRLSWTPLVLLACTLGVYAAPVVVTGQPTFTGYVKLDDTASFLGFTDQIMAHGRDLSGLAPSTYEVLLKLNLAEGYPVGTFVPLGIGSRLTGQDPAWVYQPCMAFYAAMLALALFGLARGLIGARAVRALAAFVAAQAALLYAYGLWGGIKELAAAAMIALVAALAPSGRDELASSRAMLPFALAAAATLGVLSVSGMIWVGLLALPAIVALVRSPLRSWRAALTAVVALAAFAIPALAIAREFLHYTRSNLLTQSERLGNLGHPLKLIQIFGIWPSGDFRLTPGHYTVTWILIAACALAAIVAAAYAVKTRAIRLPVAALAGAGAALLLQYDSSPWLTGKALASGSPFLVLLALAGAVAIGRLAHPVAGAAIGACIALGVLWSNVLGYRAVWIAPRGQLLELQQIGKLFGGDGPTLMTEYQPYGVRHFLRTMEAEGASELRVRPVPLIDGSSVAPGGYADLDQFRYPDLLTYRTFVLRRSPDESRPAAPYQLVWEGRFYDVWQRPASGGASVIEHIPLGTAFSPAAVPACATVRQAAALATSDHAVLAAAVTPTPVYASLTGGSSPAGTTPVLPTGDETFRTTITVPARGTYSAWLNGTLLRRVSLGVDGRRVGSVGESGILYAPLGAVSLTKGSHTVALSYGSAPFYAPGVTAPLYPIGPLAFVPAGPPAPVEYVQPDEATTLCGQTLDWLEVVSAGA